MIRKNILLIFIALLCSSCAMTGGTKSPRQEEYKPSKDFLKTALNLNFEEESTIGKAVAANILSQYKTLNNQDVNNYIQLVGEIVAGASSRPSTFLGYKFAVLDTEEINAVSAPGGIIFISKGFLKLLPNEDSLAAVLAHEITHVNKFHGLLSIKDNNFGNYQAVGDKLASAVDCGGLTSQAAGALQKAVGDITIKLLVSGYAKDDEYAADDGALEILQKTGYDTGALAQALKILEKNTRKTGGWFSTHPSANKRLSKLKNSPENSAFELKQVRTERFLKILKLLRG